MKRKARKNRKGALVLMTVALTAGLTAAIAGTMPASKTEAAAAPRAIVEAAASPRASIETAAASRIEAAPRASIGTVAASRIVAARTEIAAAPQAIAETAAAQTEMVPEIAEITTADTQTHSQTGVSDKKGYTLETELGVDGNYLSYRETPVRVTVTNYEEDFVGTVELLYSDENRNIVAYRQDLVLAAGETKQPLFLVKLPMQQSMMTVRLVDRNGKVQSAVSEALIPDLTWGSMLVGVLSDKEKTKYFTGNSNEDLLELEPEDILSADMLSMLDVIMVDQFDLGELTTAQTAILTEWTRAGGTLLLGTGSYYTETLSAFSGDFLKGKIGDLTEWSYSYREGAEEALTYCPLELEGAEIALEEDNVPLLWKIPAGEGSVLVSPISLELPSWLAGSLGEQLYQGISANISDNRLRRIEKEQNGGYVYGVRDALRQGQQGDTPQILFYGLVLLVYVLTVGPVLYAVLKKYDRRHLLWVLVPACSLIFTGIIYLLGTSTRVREPYMSYVTYLEYGGDVPKEQSYFSLTAPYNRSYDVVIEKDYRISQFRMDNYSSYYNNGVIFDDYNISIHEGDKGTNIELKNPSAFESFYFTAEGQAETEGSYEADLGVSEEGMLTGTFTNRLGYDLENVILVHQGSAFFIGDVADGSTVEIDTASGVGSGLTTFLSSRYGSNNGFMENIFGYDYYRNPDKARRYEAMNYYLNNYSWIMGDQTFLLGVTDKGAERNLTAGSEMENYGVTVPILPVDSVEADGFHYSIDEYEVEVLEGGHELPWNRYMVSNVVVSVYDFTGKNEGLPEKILYLPRYNNELQGVDQEYFPGKIYFQNRETGEYDLIFTGGVEGVCEDLTPYLADGRLVIRYELEAEQFYREQYNLVVPVLSIMREVKTDGAD